MKKINLKITVLIICCFLFQSKESNAQGVIFTKSGDTIYYTKLEHDYPYSKYWLKESNKPIKIKLDDIGNSYEFSKYDLKSNYVDEFTGNIKKESNIFVVGSTKPDINKYSINLIAWLGKTIAKDTTQYFIKLRTPHDLGCSGSSKNYVMFKFLDDKVIRVENDIADIDCSKNAVSIFVLNDETLTKLKNIKLKSVRFSQSKFYSDYDVLISDCIIKTIETIEK